MGALTTFRSVPLNSNAGRFEPLGPLDLAINADPLEVVARNRERFLVPVRQPLILLPQIQRSGGTLMTQLLDGHPELHVHHSELHIGKPKYVWPTLDLSLDAPALFAQLREHNAALHAARGYLKVSGAEESGNPNHRDFVLPFVFLESLQRRLFEGLVRRQPPTSQRQAIDHYITAYFNAWLDYHGLYRAPASVKYWIAFAARLALDRDGIERFFTDYPDGHMVVSVRDPVSWYASALAHQSRYGQLEESLQDWNLGYQNALVAARRHPGRVFFVRFEPLVADPARTMRRLLDKLGLAFDAAVLAPSFNGMPIVSNSSFGAHIGLDPSAVDRSAAVDDATARRIREMTNATWLRAGAQAEG